VELPVNRFKQGLREGRPQIGLWLGLANAYCAEICAGAGFDWLLLDGEHAPNDLRSLLEQLQAIAAYPSQPIVRLPIGDTVLIKQTLDLGVQTLLAPMVESAEQAATIVRATRYPQAGVRGVGSALARASRWNRIPDYLRRADAEMCVLAQVETFTGLEQLDAIARVEGVDGVFIGPADLAGALGHLGNPAHPDVQRAIEDAIARIRAAGKAAGILMADETLARRYLSLGCTFVGVGVDTTLLTRATQTLADKFKGAAPNTAPPAKGSVY
jgi:4-hydroxy-2-oxoheptanedioate aldolase